MSGISSWLWGATNNAEVDVATEQTTDDVGSKTTEVGKKALETPDTKPGAGWATKKCGHGDQTPEACAEAKRKADEVARAAIEQAGSSETPDSGWGSWG